MYPRFWINPPSSFFCGIVFTWRLTSDRAHTLEFDKRPDSLSESDRSSSSSSFLPVGSISCLHGVMFIFFQPAVTLTAPCTRPHATDSQHFSRDSASRRHSNTSGIPQWVRKREKKSAGNSDQGSSGYRRLRSVSVERCETTDDPLGDRRGLYSTNYCSGRQ